MTFKPLLLLATLSLVALLPSCGALGTITLSPDGSISGGITVPISVHPAK